MVDFSQLVALRHQDLLREADQERLATRLPRRPRIARRELALACLRLANWLDTPCEYARRSLPPLETPSR